MSRTFRMTAVAAVAAFALSMPAFAAQAKPAAKTAKAAKTMTVSGTLQKVEGQDLTIQTQADFDAWLASQPAGL